MTTRERKLMRIVAAPMLKGVIPYPTFAEWCAAFDKLFPATPKPSEPNMEVDLHSVTNHGPAVICLVFRNGETMHLSKGESGSGAIETIKIIGNGAAHFECDGDA